MEGGAATVSTKKASESAAVASYTNWDRKLTHDAAPRPVPRSLMWRIFPINSTQPTSTLHGIGYPFGGFTQADMLAPTMVVEGRGGFWIWF
ncbi:Hypothetical predicted protein [Olea europaea subsp. europaea]|uniref:Uncharacterized protein n=1 Tax=Olea europaea subsp. europaea TaxID=158383 RepID=A0A8S0U1U2_OLEEU|nr:Hypothetical predicted protein [Olea europaea subsp. europaea]